MLHSSTEINSQKMKYGYLWWIIDADNKIYAAIGDSGNVIQKVVCLPFWFFPNVRRRNTLKMYAYRPTMVLNGVGDIPARAKSKAE